MENSDNIYSKYELIVGFEIHVELKTKSKMFCGCKNDPFRAERPNIYTCPVCLGMPGGLPVPNQKAVEWTLLLGLALGGKVSQISRFERKNYFYPDLAKGYQISQQHEPLVIGGLVKTNFGEVRINHIHLEEDTGKLQHATVDGKKVTLIDFNRSGVPLVEIVSEPDIRNGEQTREYLKKVHQIIRYLGISDADMEKGSMRLEPNISVRKKGYTKLPDFKVEVKNLNSFNFARKAIEYEFKRQVDIVEKGLVPEQETRGYDENNNRTFHQRYKETADDYRYFPDPDIPPLVFSDQYIDSLREKLPELPEEKIKRFMDIYKLNINDAALLTETADKADYFEDCVRRLKQKNNDQITSKNIANTIINKKINFDVISPAMLIDNLEKNLSKVQISDDELKKILDKVISENPQSVLDYKNGKEQAVMFLFGKARAVNKDLDPKKTIEAIRKAIMS